MDLGFTGSLLHVSGRVHERRPILRDELAVKLYSLRQRPDLRAGKMVIKEREKQQNNNHCISSKILIKSPIKRLFPGNFVIKSLVLTIFTSVLLTKKAL